MARVWCDVPELDATVQLDVQPATSEWPKEAVVLNVDRDLNQEELAVLDTWIERNLIALP